MFSPSIKVLAPLTLSAVAMLGFAACDMQEEGSPEELGLVEVEGEDPEPVEPDEGEEYRGASERAVTDLKLDDDPTEFSFLGWHSEETPGSSQCPAGQVVTGFDCSGSYCDNVRLECHAYPGASVAGSGSWSAWFEHNGKGLHVCPSGSKVTGIDCWGSYCDNISIECTSAPGLDTARCTWTGWYSEENPSPFLADVGDAIQGMWCTGTHCDNKRFLVCET